MRSTTPSDDALLACLGLAFLVDVIIHADRLTPMIQAAVARMIDNRCEHCGYRLDHPVVRHGPPCLAE